MILAVILVLPLLSLIAEAYIIIIVRLYSFYIVMVSCTPKSYSVCLGPYVQGRPFQVFGPKSKSFFLAYVQLPAVESELFQHDPPILVNEDPVISVTIPKPYTLNPKSVTLSPKKPKQPRDQTLGCLSLAWP